MNTFLRLTLGLALSSPLPLSAQLERPQGLPLDALRIPIHTHPDDPVGGAYGIWAAGDDYKASFGRDVSFVPLLGDAYERNLPLTWRTVEARVGELDLLGGSDACTSRHTDWRWELHHARLTELWDVRAEGLEQSFRLDTRPPVDGDLVVRGRLATALHAEPRGPAHGPLDFHAFDGRPIVRYGAAFAVDARGDVQPLATSFADGTIGLHVPASLLATAAYPLTIDPLLTRITLSTAPEPPHAPDIARDDENDHRLVTLARRYSLTDYDLVSLLVSDDAVALSFFFVDVTALWSSNHPSAGFVPGADRWALAYEVTFPGVNQARIRCHVRQGGVAPPPGVTLSVDATPDRQHRHPNLGVAQAFTNVHRALLVFQQDAALTVQNTSNSQIVGVTIDAATPAVEPLFYVSSTVGDLDCEFPSVSRTCSGNSDPWMVVWQQYDNATAGDDWDVWGRLIRPDGVFSLQRQVDAASTATHAVYPKVDGRDGRFLVYRGETPLVSKTHPDAFTALRVRRVNWPFGQNPTFPVVSRTVRQDALPVYRFGAPNLRPLAFDADTRSHWAIGHVHSHRTLTLERLGYDLGTLESQVAHDVPLELARGVSITHDDDHDRFATFYAVQVPVGNHPAYLRDFGFENARSLPFGTSCVGTALAVHPGVGDAPHAGSEFFAVALQNGLPHSPTGLFLSEAPANLPFGTNCTILLDPAHLFLLTAGTSDAVGQLTVPVPLPSVAHARGDVYWQWVQLDPGNGRIVSSGGLLTEIR